ncbi:LPS assembly lipoprotein LptE [Melioribacter sp. OK-6-Me]|uniref:LPS assembly lipoprotein LptE n=1 Tax=unclassified Melioribacter TaxID=2627329 RepID=UPI003ED91C02
MAYNRKILVMVLLTMPALIVTSCSYSFTGASVPPHLQTISIPTIEDRSGKAEPNLGERLTTVLIEKFTHDNTLKVVNSSNPDCILEAAITSLTDQLSVVSGNETATTQRITINVKVVYRDLIKKKKIFERNFSQYSDYETDSADLITVRNNAIERVLDFIADDILLAVVSNW